MHVLFQKKRVVCVTTIVTHTTRFQCAPLYGTELGKTLWELPAQFSDAEITAVGAGVGEEFFEWM